MRPLPHSLAPKAESALNAQFRARLDKGSTVPSLSLSPGFHFDGKYEVIEPLGQGGPGEAYLVRHVHLETLRILRLLRSESARDSRLAHRFHRAAKTATQIRCQQIASLFDYSALPNGTFYMVSEHIQGTSVAAYLKETGPLPLQVALDLATQTLLGLEALHGAGILHRDLRPDHLMITEDGVGNPLLKIVDLGLSRSFGEEDSGNDLFGGQSYCSPEQAHALPGARIDQRSDLYSLALVLYEMISGFGPFDDRDKTILDRYDEPPSRLRDRNPAVRVPLRIERAVMRGLELDPEDRYSDARTFRRELNECCEWLRQAQDSVHSQVELRKAGQLEEDLEATDAAVPEQIGDSGSLIGIAERALREGRLDVAELCVERLESQDPVPFGVAEIRQRLQETERRRRRMQIMQTEELLVLHIRDRKVGLAKMGLSLMLELDPAYPRREEFENQISALTDGSPVERAETLLRSGQDMALRGELEAARDQLALLQQLPDRAENHLVRLNRQIEESERDQRLEVGALRVKEKLESFLEQGRPDAADKEVEELLSLGVPKTVIDLYRRRIADLRQESETTNACRLIEMKFPALLSAGRWMDARNSVLELQRLDPENVKIALMFAEVSRREAVDERRQAIQQGREVVEQYLKANEVSQAEVALATLLRMAPNHPERAELEGELKRRKVFLGLSESEGESSGKFAWSTIKNRLGTDPSKES